KDLELRGPGELLGTRQTGLAAFRLADLARDADLLPEVHAIGEQLLAGSPRVADRLIERWIGGRRAMRRPEPGEAAAASGNSGAAARAGDWTAGLGAGG